MEIIYGDSYFIEAISFSFDLDQQAKAKHIIENHNTIALLILDKYLASQKAFVLMRIE